MDKYHHQHMFKIITSFREEKTEQKKCSAVGLFASDIIVTLSPNQVGISRSLYPTKNFQQTEFRGPEH